MFLGVFFVFFLVIVQLLNYVPEFDVRGEKGIWAVDDVASVEGDAVPDIVANASPPIFMGSEESFTSIEWGESIDSSPNCCCSIK